MFGFSAYGQTKKVHALQVIAALNATKGTVCFAARRLGCDADTIQNYCKRFPTVMAAKKEHQAELVDLAELKLWDAVERGDMWAVLFRCGRWARTVALGALLK